MMTPEQLDKRVETLIQRGFKPEEAGRIAGLIGDCLEEEDGKWVVRDENDNIIAQVDPLYPTDRPHAVKYVPDQPDSAPDNHRKVANERVAQRR